MPKPLDFTKMLSKQLDKIVTSLSPENLKATLSTLREIFDNTIQHANDDKYHQIKLANKTFISKVWRYPVCEELMKMSGWVVEDDHVRLRDDSHVHITSQLRESLSEQKYIDQTQVVSSGNGITSYSIDKYETVISAVLNGDIFEIRNLLKPCNISNTGKIHCENGYSANLLYSAILSQTIDVVDLLMKEYSVNPYVADEDGELIALGVCTIAPESFIISFLKTCGVQVSFTAPENGITLLHYAVSASCFYVVCFLIEECGADVNICDDEMNTPLHTAYMYGHTHIAQYLIQHGADVTAVNANGYLPFDFIDGVSQAIAVSQTI